MRYVFLILSLLSLVATRAAAQAATQPAEAPKLLILPLKQLDESAPLAWIGSAVQQSLLVEASRMAGISPSAPSADEKKLLPVVDPERALELARRMEVRFIVFGSYQSVDQELRITGQIIDADTGMVIGGLKATGTVRDLFGMQDTLAAQMKRILLPRITPSTQPGKTTMNWWEQPEPRRVAIAEPRGWVGSDVELTLRGNMNRVEAEEWDRYRFSSPPRHTGYGDGYRHSTWTWSPGCPVIVHR